MLFLFMIKPNQLLRLNLKVIFAIFSHYFHCFHLFYKNIINICLDFMKLGFIFGVFNNPSLWLNSLFQISWNYFDKLCLPWVNLDLSFKFDNFLLLAFNLLNTLIIVNSNKSTYASCQVLFFGMGFNTIIVFVTF